MKTLLDIINKLQMKLEDCYNDIDSMEKDIGELHLVIDKLSKRKCTDEEWKHCGVEKMGCEGCHYESVGGKDGTK